MSGVLSLFSALKTDTSGSVVFSFPSDFSTSDISDFQQVGRFLLPAGNYAVDLNATVHNNSSTNGAGSQWGLAGETDALTIVDDDTMVSGPNASSISEWLGNVEGSFDELFTGSFDANVHANHSEHLTAAVINNPSTQHVSLYVATNTGATAAWVVAGSALTLTPSP